MTRLGRFSPEVRERAVRMVLEDQEEHDSQWAAIVEIAQKIGCCGEVAARGAAAAIALLGLAHARG